MKCQGANVASVFEGDDSGGTDRISWTHHSKSTSVSPNIEVPWDQGGAVASPKGLRPSGRGCSAALGPQTHCVTREAAFSLLAFLLPFTSDPVTSLPPAALCASLFQDFVPLMAENFLQFSSLNLFMASVYFIVLVPSLSVRSSPSPAFSLPTFIYSRQSFFFFSPFFFFHRTF